ncbi:DNA polymerase III, subunit gamma and tau [Gardnerella vaginalis]|uniref:DNA-directed DNA polymerase n=1 Tax=Gardnerella vaginalis TaxID=2702 RepID=A0A133P2A7_GARVA|nr:DNA polymerase III subunit gamma/tau [Gardnerella vaginalis]KXA22687.1 DNA polymerase III, subunit gamma and tau [Gardnerella vaginalis]
MALALYRRYRPDTFDGVIGQDQVTVPLSQALDQGKITHAYLFSGPRGCGKTSSARILARCINCEKGPTSHPCGKCQSCKDLATGGPGSIDVVEIDAASHNGVDDARELRERAGFAPARDRYKIFILDEAHMVTPQGFNALLKIVEEPPEHVMFIFATTEPDKVIGTIRSRTHHYPFRLVPPEVMSPYLEDICKKENIVPAPGVLRLAMRAGAGSMRDTLSVLDQLMVGAVDGTISLDSAVALLGFTPSALIEEAIDAIIAHNGAALYDVVRRVVIGGYDTRKFVEDLLGRIRDLLLMVAAGEQAASELLNDIAPEDLVALQRQSSQLTLSNLTRMAQTVNDALSGMASAVSPRMNLEILMARLLADSESATEVAVHMPSSSVNQSPVRQDTVTAQRQPNQGNRAFSGSHFVGSQRNNNNNVVAVQATNSASNTNNTNSANTATVSATQSSATIEHAKPAQVSAEALTITSASSAQSNDSRDVNEMWNEVVLKLPEDVREYVTNKYVPQVQLTSVKPGRQHLVLTFNEPMSQHAFALAVCTTAPYDGQKVPKVVMSVVHEVFGAQVMIAPAPVAANGEQVESVARMQPQQLAQVKRDILLRKTGAVAGFNNKITAGSSGVTTDSSEKKESSDFYNTDGSAASVVAEHTAESTTLRTTMQKNVLSAQQSTSSTAHLAAATSVDDDAWADMSAVPIADVVTVPNLSVSQASANQPSQVANKTEQGTESRAGIELGAGTKTEQDVDSTVSQSNVSLEHPAQSQVQQSQQNQTLSSNPAFVPMQVPATPTSGACVDECSMDDDSLEATTSVNMDELKQIFEVKVVEEFAATDPKNPKNVAASAKRKQEE